MKAVNFPATLYTTSRTFAFIKPSLYAPINQSAPCFITRCSTKPNTDSGETCQKSTFESDSHTKIHYPLPPSDGPLSSSFLSSPPTSSKRGLVLDLGSSADSWDSAEIGSPVVKRFLSDEEEWWYMWYHGSSKPNPGSDSIGLAVSSNGIHWERGKGGVKSNGDAGLVMNCSKDWWAFDTKSIRPGEVVIMSGTKVRAASAVYWMYYTGYSSERVDFLGYCSLENPEKLGLYGETDGKVRVLRSLPGLAISQDGRHWARIEGEHHSGALFEVGSEKDWDSLFIASPHVVFHGHGDLRMYYHSFDAENGKFCIGIARSRDGIKWVKLGKILGGNRSGFDELGGINPCVVQTKRDENYVMAYEGIDKNGKRSIGLAVSEDGLKNWRTIQDKAVLSPAKAADGGGCWDNGSVGSPCLVHMDADCDHEWRLYYRGVGDGGMTGIGMAVSEGSNLARFRRWSGFHF